MSGRPPFLGEHALAVIHQAADKPAPRLRSLVQNADRDLETICARCLEREPAARYRSAGDLAEDLERWLEGRPIIARPVLRRRNYGVGHDAIPCLLERAALVAMLLLVGGLFTWHWRSATGESGDGKTPAGVMEFAQMEAQVCQPGEKQMQEDVFTFSLPGSLGLTSISYTESCRPSPPTSNGRRAPRPMSGRMPPM